MLVNQWKRIESDAIALGIGLGYYPSASMEFNGKYVGQIYLNNDGLFKIDGTDKTFETWESAVRYAVG